MKVKYNCPVHLLTINVVRLCLYCVPIGHIDDQSFMLPIGTQCRLIYLLFLFRGVSGNVESKMWLDKCQFCSHPAPPIQVYFNY